jgi:hypothetical protein
VPAKIPGGSTRMADRTLAPIEPDSLYPVAVLKRITGLGDAALRQARRAGLVVRYLHGRAYVCGHDFIRYATENGSTEAPSGGKLRNES